MERALLRLACDLEFVPLVVDLYQPVLDALEYCTHLLTRTQTSRLLIKRAAREAGQAGLRLIFLKGLP